MNALVVVSALFCSSGLFFSSACPRVFHKPVSAFLLTFVARDKMLCNSFLKLFNWVIVDLTIISPLLPVSRYFVGRMFSAFFLFFSWDEMLLSLNYAWLLSLYSLNEINAIYESPARLVMPDWHWSRGDSIFAPQTQLSPSLRPSRKCETPLAYYGLSAVTRCGRLRVDDVIAVTNRPVQTRVLTGFHSRWAQRSWFGLLWRLMCCFPPTLISGEEVSDLCLRHFFFVCFFNSTFFLCLWAEEEI